MCMCVCTTQVIEQDFQTINSYNTQPFPIFSIPEDSGEECKEAIDIPLRQAIKSHGEYIAGMEEFGCCQPS